MKYTILLIAFLLLCGSCQQNASDNNRSAAMSEMTGPPPPPKEVSSTDLAARLSSHFIKNPTRQPEIDQNEIVAYAIDKGLDVQRSASGMYYQIVHPGDGKNYPTAGSKVQVHYEGQLLDGTVFDSSFERDKPLTFKMPQVILGWQEAVKMLKPGGRGIFLIPSRIAYGKEGFKEAIPPNTPLKFDILLLDMKQ